MLLIQREAIGLRHHRDGRSAVPRAAPARLTPRMIWNAEAETMPAPAARAALQAERLRATVAWAVERVPFYRERLGGVSVRGLDDLPRLPFTRKSDLREHYPFGLFAVPRPSSLASTPRRAPRASRPWSATRPAISTCGAR